MAQVKLANAYLVWCGGISKEGKKENAQPPRIAVLVLRKGTPSRKMLCVPLFVVTLSFSLLVSVEVDSFK